MACCSLTFYSKRLCSGVGRLYLLWYDMHLSGLNSRIKTHQRARIPVKPAGSREQRWADRLYFLSDSSHRTLKHESCILALKGLVSTSQPGWRVILSHTGVTKSLNTSCEFQAAARNFDSDIWIPQMLYMYWPWEAAREREREERI